MDLGTTIRDGGLLSVIASIYLLILLRAYPRLFLRHYPKAVRDVVPAKSAREITASSIVGVPFIVLLLAAPIWSTVRMQNTSLEPLSFGVLFANAFGVIWLFNLVDLLILDWLIVCFFTPKWVILPGSEHLQIPKPYFDHFRGFLTGTVLSVVVGLGTAACLSFLKNR
jgi:hypothetical protein